MNHSFFSIHSSSPRGQASLEFILVLIFMLVIMVAVVVPLGQRVQFAMDDVSKTGFADAGLKTVESSLNNILIVPGTSRQTIDIYLPKGTSFFCSNKDKNVGFTFPLNTDVFDATGNAPINCIENPPPALTTAAMLCSKGFLFPAYAKLQCQGDQDPNALGFVIEAGQSGFSQHFRIVGQYDPAAPTRYVVDFNAV